MRIRAGRALFSLQRVKELPLRGEFAIQPQPGLALAIVENGAGHKAQAFAVGKGAANGRVAVQPDDVRCLAKIAFDPIDDGAGRKAARSEVGVYHDENRHASLELCRQTLTVDSVRRRVAQRYAHGKESNAQ